MSKKKHCPIWAIAQVSQRGNNSVGVLNSSWQEKKSSHLHTASNGMDYLEPLEESTWSQNIDSAASMFPPSVFPPSLDLNPWGENFQDLSSWCHKPPQDMSSIMVGDTKGSSCTAQDDELNTPDIGVHREFNFTSSSSTLKEDTPPCQSDGEGWEIQPPLDLPQILSLEEDKSVVTVKKTDSDNTQCTPANGFFLDEAWGLSVSHEEEIVSSHIKQEGLNLVEVTQDKESDTLKTSVNTYELGVQCGVKGMDTCESLGIDNHMEVKMDTVRKTDIKNGSIESLLETDFNAKSLGNGLFSVGRVKQQADNLNLKNLLAGSICHINNSTSDKNRGGVEATSVDILARKAANTVTAKSQVISPLKTNVHLIFQNMGSEESFPEEGSGKIAFADVNGSEKFCEKNVTAATTLRTDVSVKVEEQPNDANCKQSETVVPPEILAKNLQNMSSVPHLLVSNEREGLSSEDGNVMKQQFEVKEENASKRNLKLNLATLLGTDEIISTPVVLEPLFKRDEPFDLLAYVFDDAQAFHLDSPDTIQPVALDGRVPTSCTTEGTTTKVDPVITEIEPLTNDVELLDNFQEHIAVNVIRPFITEKSDGQWNVSHSEHMEVEEMEDTRNVFLPSSVKLLEKSDQQFKAQKTTNGMKGLVGNKGENFHKVRENRKDLACHTTLESKILQDGPALKLKISKRKLPAGQGSSTNVPLSQKEVSARKNVSEVEGPPLSRQTRGRPVKRVNPSTSKEKNKVCSNSRSLQRKLSVSSSSVDVPLTPPSKRSRQSSVDSECDRYRELRDRNNEASRKSRQSRRARECEMKETAAKLERENQTLMIKADELERLVKKLREALLEAMTKTKRE